MKFTDLPLKPEILEAIDSMGYENTTPIQEMAIPSILEGRDLIGCAQTGTGKTAAYLIPLLQLFHGEPSAVPRALIIVPTRELAEQIDQNLEALAYFTTVSSVAVYGGKNSDNWDKQKKALVGGADILIVTPGRMMSHMGLGYVNLSQVEVVVLDEADKMLDMGFYGDIIKLIKDIPASRQTLLFSATMPPQIRKLAQEILKSEPVEINLNLAKPAANINQMAYFAGDTQKIALLEHVIRTREVESMIIFASSKISVDRIHRTLESLKYPVKAIHSDKEQEERSETLRQFKNRQFKILVGTDVLSRGIDIDSLSHVLNYDVPPDAEDYVHRAGRTARAGAFGEAISFISPKDIRRWQQIERLIGYEVKKYDLPEEVGPAPDMSEGRERGGFDRRRGGGPPDRRGPAPDRRGPGGPPRNGQGPRQEDRGPRQDNRGPRPDDRGPRMDTPGPRPENRGPRPENPNAPRPEQGPLAEGEVVRKKRKKKRNRPRPQGVPGAVAGTNSGTPPPQVPQNEAGTGENRSPKPRRRHRPRPKNGPGPQAEVPPSAE